MIFFSDEYYMEIALQQAQLAAQNGEIPVGAVVVCNNRIIAKTHNQTEQLTDVTAHAELLAITAAAGFLGSKYLKDCTLYVTLEPCLMCAGALFWSQIDKIVFAARDEKRGFGQVSKTVLHPKTKVTGGVLEKESREILEKFFRQMRT